MIDDITALKIAAKRTQFDLSDHNTWPYILVGSGAYVEQLLTRIDKGNLRLPEYILVQEKVVLSVDVEQRIDNGKSPIDASHIVLGTGSFQLEMLHRLLPRCDENTVFIDVMECAPKTFRTLGDTEQYLIYVDLYSDINIPKYLTNFFEFLNSHAMRVEVFHPLENLSDEYIKNSQGLIVWNGSFPAFVPILTQVKRLSQNITFAECGFFPQAQFFYLDKCGVNAQSQLYQDDLTWVTVNELSMLEKARSHYQTQHQVEQGNYILVPLQVPTDSNIINHSRFTNGMQKFIDYIEALYPDEQLWFKPHPKDRFKDSYHYRLGKSVEGDLNALIAGAKKVHGINSSVLYEAALMGKEVIVEGDCLLKQHAGNTEKLLAAMLARQFHINDTNVSQDKVTRFSHLQITQKQRLAKGYQTLTESHS
jgi:hypothetical protein